MTDETQETPPPILSLGFTGSPFEVVVTKKTNPTPPPDGEVKEEGFK